MEEADMNSMWKRTFVGALLLAVLAACPSLLAAATKSEDQLIQDLGSPDSGKVTDALQQLEKQYPTGMKALPTIKKLLTDSRVKVRRKAARVLGAVHAEVDQDDVKNICALLKSSDPEEVTDVLKGLRGLKAPTAVPEILPLLKDPNQHLVRDACRTLAVLGNKDTISAVEPLLESPDPAVKKDAQNAIFQLRQKS
jgi:HEAT repeat protein